MNSHAVMSECGRYRYSLTRHWGTGHRLLFIMLNPSTADEHDDDPTIRRCIGFAQRNGFGELHVCNLFAYRATVPRQLRTADDPVGPLNDEWIQREMGHASLTVAAWGAWPGAEERAREVVKLAGHGPLFCLGTTKDGSPRHPLYVPRSQPFKFYKGGNASDAGGA